MTEHVEQIWNYSKKILLLMAGSIGVALLVAANVPATYAQTAPASAQEATGNWLGFIEVAPGTRLPLVLHIKRDDTEIGRAHV